MNTRKHSRHESEYSCCRPAFRASPVVHSTTLYCAYLFFSIVFPFQSKMESCDSTGTHPTTCTSLSACFRLSLRWLAVHAFGVPVPRGEGRYGHGYSERRHAADIRRHRSGFAQDCGGCCTEPARRCHGGAA